MELSSSFNKAVIIFDYWDRINSIHLSDISGPCRKKTYSTSPDEEHALEFPGAGGSHDEDNGETRPSSGKIGCNKVSKNVLIKQLLFNKVDFTASNFKAIAELQIEAK